MKRARVKNTGEVISINREQDGHYLSKRMHRRLMGSGMVEINVWYRPDELEEVE